MSINWLAFAVLSCWCWPNFMGRQIASDLSSRFSQSSGANISFLKIDARHLFSDERSARQWTGYLRGSMRPTIIHIHVPKAAGTAFALDINRSLLDYSILSAEQSVAQLNVHFQTKPSDVSVVLLRDPRTHVYAQFLECADSPWGQLVTRDHREYFDPVNSSLITPWLRFFSNGFTNESFGCYHPFNLQTRFLGSDWKQWHSNSPRFAESNESLWQAARYKLRHVEVVGTVDRYQESLCMLHVKVTGRVPHWCNCVNRTAWTSFKSADATQQDITHHGVRPHSWKDLSAEDVRMIDALTQDDQRLYNKAKERLADDLGKVWKKHGVPIWCDP